MPGPSSGGYQVTRANKKIARVSKEDAEEGAGLTWADRHQIAKALVVSVKFDLALGALILVNAIVIGLQQDFELASKSTVVFQALESVFLVFYIAEFTVRWTAHGRSCLHDNWVKMDLVLILVGGFTAWLLEPLVPRILPDAAELSDNFGPLMVLRTLRLLRLAKFARIFARNREAWLLIRGFLNCLPMVLYTFVVYAFCLYFFAVMGVELITKNDLMTKDPDFRDQAMKYFGTLMKAGLTLVRFACLDSTAEVYVLLVEKDPALAFYFVPLIFMVSLVLFHLLGAVIFISTFEQTQQEIDSTKMEQEGAWSDVVSGLRELFFRLDADMSGQLSREELSHIDPRDMKVLRESLGGRDMTPMQVFAALDVDKSGEISIDEFFDGIRDLALDRVVLDQKRMEKQVETIHWRLKEMYSAQYETKLLMTKLIQDLGVKSNQAEVAGERSQAGSDLLTPWANGMPSSRKEPRKESARSETVVPASARVAAKPASAKLADSDLPAWARQLNQKLSDSLEHCMEQVRSAVEKVPARTTQAAAAAKGGSTAASSRRQQQQQPVVAGTATNANSLKAASSSSAPPAPPKAKQPSRSGPSGREEEFLAPDDDGHALDAPWPSCGSRETMSREELGQSATGADADDQPIRVVDM